MRHRNYLVDQIEVATHEAVIKAGGTFDREVFKKSLEKAKRWMKAAYGAVDYETFLAESGADISAYYNETVAVPDGGDTFNRATFNNKKK